jgi:two-component system, chemotaxis family, chemotaxis protein CheY
MGKKVLIADDSKTMRAILRRSLADMGISSATEAADGNEAVTLFDKGHFDLVLTSDWCMSGKNGLELARDIRAKNERVPIIMIATDQDKEQIHRAIDAGVSDYLLKPFTSRMLHEKIGGVQRAQRTRHTVRKPHCPKAVHHGADSSR